MCIYMYVYLGNENHFCPPYGWYFRISSAYHLTCDLKTGMAVRTRSREWIMGLEALLDGWNMGPNYR